MVVRHDTGGMARREACCGAKLRPWRGFVRLPAWALVAFLVWAVPLRAGNGAQPPAAPLETVRLQLKWRHQFQFAGYYAAIEKGFFAREGLNVELVEGEPLLIPSDRLFNGRAEYAVDSPAVLLQRQAGRPLVALAAVFQHSATVLLTLREKGYASPQMLAGKRVMLSDPTDPECLAMFMNEGLEAGEYTAVPHNWGLDDLVEGRIEAQSAYVTNEPYQLLRRGLEPGVIAPANYAVDFYGDCLVTGEDEIREHPERVEGFLRAMREGWRYAMDHSGEIADLILARYSQEKTRAALLYEARAMRPLVMPELVEIGHMNPDRWRHMAAIYARVGVLPADFSLEGFLYEDFRSAAAAREKRFILRLLLGLGLSALLAGFCGGLLLAFNRRLRRKVAERTAQLQASRDFLGKIINSISDPIFVKDQEHRYILANEAAENLAGSRPGELVGRTDRDYFPPELVKLFWQRDDAVFRTGLEDVIEERFSDASGATRIMVAKKTRYVDASGRPFVVGIVRDVSEQMQGAERLSRTLAEKEVMLKEIHHRVKNNLQIISSMLYLQLQYVSNPADRVLFTESQSRILSMALVHEGLYSSGDLASVALGDYIPRLVGQILASGRRDVAAEYALADVRLPITRSIPFGLILNELVMNAAKHAFAGRQGGRLRIELCREGSAVRLAVEDDGPGLPPGFELSAPATLGLTLVASLTEQLHGRLSAVNAPGARFTLTFDPDGA